MRLLKFADQLAQPELRREERLSIAAQLLMLFNVFDTNQECSPSLTLVETGPSKSGTCIDTRNTQKELILVRRDTPIEVSDWLRS